MVEEINKPVHTDITGDYWRPLLAGTYKVTASKTGFISETVEVKIFIYNFIFFQIEKLF